MTFYLAGPYSDRKRLSACAGAIARESGWECNARWLRGDHDGMLPTRAAREDVKDVRAADALVMFAERSSTRGGMWVEFGIAVERGIPIVVICDQHVAKLNVFAWLHTAGWAGCVNEAAAELRHIAESRARSQAEDMRVVASLAASIAKGEAALRREKSPAGEPPPQAAL